MAPSILYWVQVNTGRQHSHSHPFFRKFSQFNRTLRQFSKKVSVQSKVGMLASRTLWRPYVGFIRSCHNPIGRAQPKNWNLWLCHIKQRSGKKVDKVLCWKYRDWWQSIRGMTREVLKCLLLLYESKEWPKKGTRRPTKTAKNTQIVIFGKKKKRLRQAASRGKLSFSWRNAIWAKKKKRLRQAASQKRSKMPTFFAEKNGKKH